MHQIKNAKEKTSSSDVKVSERKYKGLNVTDELESVIVWLDITEDAIETVKEKVDEYKAKFGEHGEIEAMLKEKLDYAIGYIEDAYAEAGRLE